MLCSSQATGGDPEVSCVVFCYNIYIIFNRKCENFMACTNIVEICAMQNVNLSRSLICMHYNWHKIRINT